MSENTSSMPDLTTQNITSEFPFTKRNNDQTKQNTKFQDEKKPRGFSHQSDLIRAAMPYATGSNQQSMNVFLKVSELMQTMQAPEPELSTCSMENSKEAFNMEGLLSSLKNVCYQREADIINMLLNTLHARRFYQTYQTVAATMADEPSLSAASLGGNNGRNHSTQNNNARANGGSNNMNAILNNPLMKDMLDSFMTPDQRSNFNNITNMINTMSTMNSMNNMNPTNGMNNNNNNMNNNTPNNNSNNMNSGMNNSINNAMNIMNAMNNTSNSSMNNGMNNGMNGGMNNAMNIMNAMSAMNSMNNASNYSATPNMNAVNNMNNDTSPSNNTNNVNSMGNMNPTNSSRSSVSPNNYRNNMNRGGMNNRNSMNPPTMNHLHVMDLKNTSEDLSYPDLDQEDITPDLA